MQVERPIKDCVYPPELNAVYHKYNVITAHWDAEAEPEKLVTIQALEREIYRLQALYEVDIAAYLHEDNWETVEWVPVEA